MTHRRHHHAGFTLVELSISLVIIALIVAAVTNGRDVLRAAHHTRLLNEFVQGWVLAYDRYTDLTGLVPGDSASAPTGWVNGNSTLLCNEPPTTYALNNLFLARGITLPQGRELGYEDRYLYQDSRSLPHEARLCFQNVQWSEPGTTQGSYVVRRRNVMVLTGITPELAYTLDKQVDGRLDARFGRVRQSTQANSTDHASTDWSANELSSFDGIADAGTGESQSAEMTVYLLMSR